MTMMMREIARHQKISEEEETRKTAKKRPFVAFSVETLIFSKISSSSFLLNPEFFTHKIFSLSLRFENALVFWSVFFVFVRSFLSLCICASELENFL